MGSIVNTLQDIAESLESVVNPDTSDPYSFTFYHCEPHEFNTKDSAVFPFVYLRHPLTASKPVSKAGVVDSVYNVALFFGHKSEKQLNMQQRQTRVDEMESALNEFVSKLFQEESIEIVGTPESDEVFDDFDFNSDGWYLMIKIKLTDVAPC